MTLVAARLDEVAAINPSPTRSLPPDEEVSFLPMAAVDSELVEAVDTEVREYAEVSKGYTPFVAGDVLVAKITPCFENGKIALAKPRRAWGFGSTEFHVVRADRERLDPRYLVHYLRQSRVRIEGERKMTGSAGQRRVPQHFLSSLQIPLPPLGEQRRIAAILDKADELRAKRRAALAKLDTLTQSIFLDMFGDPATNPKGWPVVAIRDVAEVGTGGTPSREVAGFYGGAVPWVKTTEVTGDRIFATDEHLTEAGLRAIRGRIYPAGSVVVAMYGQGKTRGRASILGLDAAVNQACAVIQSGDRLDSDFLLAQLRLGYDRLRGLGRGGNQPNLNLELVGSFPLTLPPASAQASFSTRVQAMTALSHKMKSSGERADELFAVTQHQAFRGQL